MYICDNFHYWIYKCKMKPYDILIHVKMAISENSVFRKLGHAYMIVRIKNIISLWKNIYVIRPTGTTVPRIFAYFHPSLFKFVINTSDIRKLGKNNLDKQRCLPVALFR
jgi:hypothetical protein